MNIVMVERTCLMCPKTFKVMDGDSRNYYCGSWCRDRDPNAGVTVKEKQRRLNPSDRQAAAIAEQRKKECQKVETSGKTATSITVARGEAPKGLKSESKEKRSTGPGLRLQTTSGSTKESAGKPSMESKTKTAPAVVETTTTIEKKELPPARNTDGPIERGTMSTNAITTIEPKKSDLPESEKTDSEETLPLGYKAFFGELELEKQSSVKLLHESAESLVNLAEELLGTGKKDEIEGGMIQRPNVTNVDTALRAMEGARNLLKTKLDYLKFGKELVTERKGKQ